jgi:hypothetical protein
MRATRLFATSEVVCFGIFFFETFLKLDERVDLAGRATLGTFEFCGLGASLYLLSDAGPIKASLLDWLACALLISSACIGLASFSITGIALYLIIRGSHNLYTRAAGTVAAAVAIQAIWAPLIFSKLSFFLLQVDAGAVGWLESQLLPGSTWSGTIVLTPSGHNVVITEACASFHNLSLASLCWVTLTMLHRPHWVKSDLYIGLAAAFIQFGFNIWRLVFVCMSLPMYEFWHDGYGKHIFSAAATACAIIFVQTSLALRDQRHTRAAAAISN